MDDLVAGVDLATAEARVTVTDGRGRVRAGGRAALPPPYRPRPGWSEQDARGWWPAVVAALRQATTELGGDRWGVVAVAVSATSGTVVVADAAGEPIGPALLYDDRRAGDTSPPAMARWGWLLAHAGAGAEPRFAWHASDLVVARLTGGPPATDWSTAHKSGYDPVGRRWPDAALAALRVPARLLPEVLAPTAAAGTVCPEAAAATGLPGRCQVRLGMTDGCAAQIAAGADRPGRFVSVVGTTLVLKGATTDAVHDPTGAVYSHRHPDGWWLPGGASNTGGEAVTAAFPGADLAALDARARAHGPAGCVTYPLTRAGERFPFVAPDATGFWVGEPDGDDERYRATLEGVAFVERLGYEHLAAVGAAVEPPFASAGGGTRSRVWTTIRATVLSAELVVPARPETSFGACVLAAAGTLHPDLTAAGRAMVRTAGSVHPVEAEGARLDESYRRLVGELRRRGWLGDATPTPRRARPS
jgi:D-ribulokinase